MQYLKEEIKNRITLAALNEFRGKGFLDASMRKIAHNAGVALGNVYRYFKNKDELFNAIIEPVYTQFMSIVLHVAKTDAPAGELQCIFSKAIVEDVVDRIMEVYTKYETELLIMIDQSKGSKYENIKENLILLIDNRLKKELLPRINEHQVVLEDDFLMYVISSTFVEGVFIILRKYTTDDKKIRQLISQMLILYFNDIQERFQ